MGRRLAALLVGGCLLGASGAGIAGPYYSVAGDPEPRPAQGRRAEAPAPRSPYDIVQFGIGELRGFLSRERARDPDAIEAFLGTVIAPYFDFETMSRWAAGPFYRELGAHERTRLREKIRGMFLEALARNLGSYALAVPPVQILPPLSRRWGDEMVVRARVLPEGAYPVMLDFRFYQRDDRWRIFDVAANGFSAVSFYRRHFAALVRAGGPAALYR